MVYFLFYKNNQGKYVYAHGPAAYYQSRFVANILSVWLSNNGFTSWTVEMWEYGAPDHWVLTETF